LVNDCANPVRRKKTRFTFLLKGSKAIITELGLDGAFTEVPFYENVVRLDISVQNFALS
jgi:hypothetical protein